MWWAFAKLLVMVDDTAPQTTAFGFAPDTAVALIAIAGSLGLAAVAWLHDRKSATAITARLDAVETRTARQDQIIFAQRDYINELINWATTTTDPVPRRVPSPPELLMGGPT